ncbi:MAG: diaminopimelate epimerase [Bacteroidetes bacterium]|jgi:diaminopimelate epimerase|nr:diaminopimelate epimerase [Bacteroidota bacterium]
MTLHFSKYQGTGNDFILIDNRDKIISLTREQVKFLCDRRFGIGADGLMLLELTEGSDFKMVYYNSDGNESSMCGNGGRCISAFAKKLGLIQNETTFIAVDGEHKSILSDTVVRLQMNDVKGIERISEDFYLNTGSPHYVRLVSGLKDFDVYEEGRKIRYNDRFAAEGTNVNFIEKTGDALHVRTYERGVEDETFSCGTGVTAAALIAAHLQLFAEKDQCRIQTPGGQLTVKYQQDPPESFSNIWLEGPAIFVFEGNIELK